MTCEDLSFESHPDLDCDFPRLAFRARQRSLSNDAASISGEGLASSQDADCVAVVAQRLDTEYGLDLPSGGGPADVDIQSIGG